MGMKYTQIPSTAFQEIQLNAGILVESFTPATGAFSGLIGASSGGITFEATPEFVDFGDDIDNCPKNMKELKKLDTWEAKLSGTFATVTASLAKKLVGAADMASNKVTPRSTLETSDFFDIWWIGDYSDKNGTNNGGYCAIHLMNALSTGGFKIQSSDKEKGKFEFEFTGHVSMNSQDTVPFEVYIKAGTAESGAYNMTITSVAGSTTGKTKLTTSETKTSSESYVYQTGYGLAIPSQNTVLTGTAWTSWDGSADVTATTGMDVIVAIIDSDSKAQHAGKTSVVSKEA